MDPLDLLEKAFSVGKWIYDQFNMMEDNKSEAQVLAGRILRLSGVAKFSQNSSEPKKRLSRVARSRLKSKLALSTSKHISLNLKTCSVRTMVQHTREASSGRSSQLLPRRSSSSALKIGRSS